MLEDGADTQWWWIDYLEDEMDPGLDSDLQLLLQHSQEDRDSFEQFRLLREWLRDSDPVTDWPLGERIARVRKRVMAAIADESPYLPPNDSTKALSV